MIQMAGVPLRVVEKADHESTNLEANMGVKSLDGPSQQQSQSLGYKDLGLDITECVLV